MTYEHRVSHARNAAGRKLLKTIARKKSNLAVAADVGTIDEMLRLADQVTLSCLSLPLYAILCLHLSVCLSKND